MDSGEWQLHEEIRSGGQPQLVRANTHWEEQGSTVRTPGRQLEERGRAAGRTQLACGRAYARRGRRRGGSCARSLHISLQRLEQHVELARDVRVRAFAARRHRELAARAITQPQRLPERARRAICQVAAHTARVVTR